MSDARHEFDVGLVALRSVPVVSERNDNYDGRVGTKRGRKQRVYRALSGVSFQSSVDPSYSNSYQPSVDVDDYQAEREEPTYWIEQATPAPVRVTFVKRTITDYSTIAKRSVTDEEEDDDEIDQAIEESHNAGEQHIYDTPCSLDELYSELLSDSDFSGLDLSIFEQSNHAETKQQLESRAHQQGFIYRPPRPKRTPSRGKALKDRIKRPLKRLFNAPEPPAVDYNDADYVEKMVDEARSQSASPLPRQNSMPVTDLDGPAADQSGQLPPSVSFYICR